MPSFANKERETNKPVKENRDFLCGLFKRDGKFGTFYKGRTTDGYEIYLQENTKQGETQPEYYLTISKEPVEIKK
jgi:hypothetical protein